MDGDLPFLLPVLLEPMSVGAQGIPERFWTKPLVETDSGRPTDTGVAWIKEQLRFRRRMEAER